MKIDLKKELGVDDVVGPPRRCGGRTISLSSRQPETPAIERLRIASVDEGRCVQTLHVGPYDDEGPVLARMHDEAIAGRGLRMRGHHHEIYLGDPRRTAPERLRTILRQPVTGAETS
ncbi:GyrI-like domain-containing protein [Microbacterium luteum]|uniref:GyrI-like domain-containing protein n=1 Tax=Microbacterium luteum TaxID=2782167 RepID=UPI003AF892E4